jgi:hypothetical protein
VADIGKIIFSTSLSHFTLIKPNIENNNRKIAFLKCFESKKNLPAKFDFSFFQKIVFFLSRIIMKSQLKTIKKTFSRRPGCRRHILGEQKMEMGHLFEAVMLVCFGFSWPLNVIKAYKARSAKGTSLAFIILIITGYVAGLTAKFINHQFNYVLAVYFLNLAIVMSNLVVYFRNVALDKKRENNIKNVEVIRTPVGA